MIFSENIMKLIEVLNISIVISLLMVSFILHHETKKRLFINIFFVSLIEVIAYFFARSTLSIELYYITSFIIKTFTYLLITDNKIFTKIIVILLSVLGIYFIKNNVSISLIFMVGVNATFAKCIIVDQIKVIKEELHINSHKLSKNKKYIATNINDISEEVQLQTQYKNEIIDIDSRINSCIIKSDNPIFVLTADKNFLFGNREFYKLIGTNNLSKNDSDYLSKLDEVFVDLSSIIDLINNYSTNEGISININSYENKIYKLTCTLDIVDSKGRIVCIFNDITQSILIQNRLRESEEKYKRLMDILSDGVIIHSKSTISYMNNKVKEIFKLNSEHAKIPSIDDIKNKIDNKYRVELDKNINEVLLKGVYKSESKVKTEDGKYIQLITTSIVLNDMKMLLTLAIDVTNLEKVILDLEESEKTYKLLLQALPEGIIIIDKYTKRHLYRNKEMINILKDIGVDSINDMIKLYLLNGKYGSYMKFDKLEKENLEVSLVIIEIEEERNLLGVIRVIDKRSKVEIMESKLKEIKHDHRFKMEFLANVAKDLKKPIQTISSVNDILVINKQNYRPYNIENYAKLIKQNCYRLTRLLNNIDEIVNIESGLYRLNMKKYNLVEVLKEIVNNSSPYIKEKGLELEFNIKNQNIISTFDKSSIEKVILNIISNSIKFTDSGGKIQIDIEDISNKVYIKVKDTGIGIPKDKLDIIFENFEQVDRTLSRGAEGTGVGLSLAKKIIEMHSGEINVKSEEGIGSEFEIILYLENREYEEVTYEGEKIFDKEKIDIEFSDIYLDMNNV